MIIRIVHDLQAPSTDPSRQVPGEGRGEDWKPCGWALRVVRKWLVQGLRAVPL